MYVFVLFVLNLIVHQMHLRHLLKTEIPKLEPDQLTQNLL